MNCYDETQFLINLTSYKEISDICETLTSRHPKNNTERNISGL